MHRVFRMQFLVFLCQRKRLKGILIPHAAVFRREIVTLDVKRPPAARVIASAVRGAPFTHREAFSNKNELGHVYAVSDDDGSHSYFGWGLCEMDFNFTFRPLAGFKNIPIRMILRKADRLQPELALARVSKQFVQGGGIQSRPPEEEP